MSTLEAALHQASQLWIKSATVPLHSCYLLKTSCSHSLKLVDNIWVIAGGSTNTLVLINTIPRRAVFWRVNYGMITELNQYSRYMPATPLLQI